MVFDLGVTQRMSLARSRRVHNENIRKDVAPGLEKEFSFQLDATSHRPSISITKNLGIYADFDLV